MIIATVVFFISLAAIVALLGLKYWETRRGVSLAPALRARADQRALELKSTLMRSRGLLAELPPEALKLTRLLVREAALALAALARHMERGAHSLADFVSHKHRFEKRESSNAYLKQVTDFRNGSAADERTE